jgi:hypothetical protein
MSSQGSSCVRSIVTKMTVATVLAAAPAVGLSIPVHATPTGSHPAAPPPSTNSPQPPPPPPPGRQTAPDYDWWNYGGGDGGGGGGGG